MSQQQAEVSSGRCVRAARIVLECYDHYVVVEDWRGKILFTADARAGRDTVGVQAWVYPERGLMATVRLGSEVFHDFDTLERNYCKSLGSEFLPAKIRDHITTSLNLHQLT